MDELHLVNMDKIDTSLSGFFIKIKRSWFLAGWKTEIGKIIGTSKEITGHIHVTYQVVECENAQKYVGTVDDINITKGKNWAIAPTIERAREIDFKAK